MKRTCGGCTACCTVMGVAELDKPAWQPCAHECAEGCAVYTTRPQSCAEYSCLWLLDPQNLFRNMERPDRVGVVLDISDQDSPVTEHLGQQAVLAREVRSGAFDESAAKAMLDRLEKRVVVVRLTPDGVRRLRGPERLVRLIRKKT